MEKKSWNILTVSVAAAYGGTPAFFFSYASLRLALRAGILYNIPRYWQGQFKNMYIYYFLFFIE